MCSAYDACDMYDAYDVYDVYDVCDVCDARGGNCIGRGRSLVVQKQGMLIRM